MAQSHYLKKCWVIISEALWNSPEGNFTGNAHDIHPRYSNINNLRLQPHLPGASELMPPTMIKYSVWSPLSFVLKHFKSIAQTWTLFSIDWTRMDLLPCIEHMRPITTFWKTFYYIIWSHIWSKPQDCWLSYHFTLKFDRLFGSSAVKAPVKFQSILIILSPYLTLGDFIRSYDGTFNTILKMRKNACEIWNKIQKFSLKESFYVLKCCPIRICIPTVEITQWQIRSVT